MLFFRLQAVVFFLLFSFISIAQKDATMVIKIDNPGFEGTPQFSARYISGWIDCGKFRFAKESPVDLQPGFFDVVMAPYKGRSYLGMVARDNESWESVTQLLRKPLQPNQCYTFSAHLAASPTYKSNARGEGIAVEEARANDVDLEFIHHTTPIVLRIWGTKDQCSPAELLAESPIITNNEWEKYDFRFEPKEEMNFIMLEAFYKTPSPFPDNGHILIDELSDIVAIPCSMDPPIVDIVTPKKSGETEKTTYQVKAKLQNVFNKDDIDFMLNNKRYSDFDFDIASGEITAEIPLKKGINKIDIKGSNPEGQRTASASIRQMKESKVIVELPAKSKEDNTVAVQVDKKEELTLEGVKRIDLRKNQKLEIKNLSFNKDVYEIEDTHEKTLLRIVDFLKVHKDITIEIGGHTNKNCADKYCLLLSEKRAQSVASFLIEKGIAQKQLLAKGYGRTQLIINSGKEYANRKNQRVEIKIIDLGS